MTVTPGQTIKELSPGHSARLLKLDYGGSLEARRLNSGNVMFYWRYTQREKTERVPIGPYDSSAPPKALKATTRGYSVAAAAEAARELAKRNAEIPGGLRAERAREKAAQEAATKTKAEREKHTLAALCAEYCDWLERQGKDSHSDVRNIFSNHLIGPFPRLAGQPAAEVEKRQIVEVVRKVAEAGKLATARKLRAYLRAAYACAARADSDPALPSAFIAYGVTHNPVEATAAIRGKADKNPLPLADLRRYWKALQGEDGVIGAALRLHVLSGGQRAAQLTRLADTDVEAGALRLVDRKGKRSEPRLHLVPVTKAISAELKRLSPAGYLLSTDGGKTPMHPTSISAWASDLAKQAKITDFQLKRIRSGIETQLARLGVSKEVRGQLQSHGISGVQDVHYNAHEFMDEKRTALDALLRLLEGKEASNVVRIRRHAK